MCLCLQYETIIAALLCKLSASQCLCRDREARKPSCRCSCSTTLTLYLQLLQVSYYRLPATLLHATC